MEAPTTIVATDGSLRGETTAWAGAVWRGNQIVYEWSAAKQGRSSSFRSECEAFEDALIWLSGNTEDTDKTLLLTDSLSLVSKLQVGMIKDTWAHHIRQIKGVFKAVYVPGHSGISFNEKADELAGKALPFGDLVRVPTDVLSDLREKMTEEERIEQDMHWSTQRMKERGWKYGEGAKCTVRGKERSVHTQIETGVITLNTLRKLIEGGGPELRRAPLLL